MTFTVAEHITEILMQRAAQRHIEQLNAPANGK
jgi:hypothetical protein